MSVAEPWYWKYARPYLIYGDEGLVGIRDDAPEDIKKAFYEDRAKEKKIREKAEAQGYLIS